MRDSWVRNIPRKDSKIRSNAGKPSEAKLEAGDDGETIDFTAALVVDKSIELGPQD